MHHDLQQEPDEQNHHHAAHIHMLSSSLQHWTGQTLDASAYDIYHAPFALLSHGKETDPIINYANLSAQQLFKMRWHELVHLPSRLSAEAMERKERDVLLQRVTETGYIDDYSGIRIAKSGQRFLIQQATVWNLCDTLGQFQGQAAMFADWQMLSGDEQATLGA